jgi:hypothetical protein
LKDQLNYAPSVSKLLLPASLFSNCRWLMNWFTIIWKRREYIFTSFLISLRVKYVCFIHLLYGQFFMLKGHERRLYPSPVYLLLHELKIAPACSQLDGFIPHVCKSCVLCESQLCCAAFYYVYLTFFYGLIIFIWPVFNLFVTSILRYGTILCI